MSPDGTEYRFDWLVTRPLPYLTKANAGAEYATSPPVTTDSAAKTSAKTDSAGGVATPDSIGGNALARVEVWILPTQITDRFGNTVTYTYNQTNKWQLESIVGNDIGGSPRTITLSYSTPGSLTSSLVTSVFDGTRTWNYTYNSATGLFPLATVTLPDGSAWKELESMPAGGGFCLAGRFFRAADRKASTNHSVQYVGRGPDRNDRLRQQHR